MKNSQSNEGLINKQGRIHEESAINLIGGDAQNLNKNERLKNMGLYGDNYPIYDIFSSTEICSVKTRIKKNGKPNIQQYKNEFLKRKCKF